MIDIGLLVGSSTVRSFFKASGFIQGLRLGKVQKSFVFSPQDAAQSASVGAPEVESLS